MAACLPVCCSHLDPRKRYLPPLRLSRARRQHSAHSPAPQPGRAAPRGTHRHHVITLHVGLVIVSTFVVELAEEVERHHGIEINHHGQETDGQDQLGAEREEEVGLHLERLAGDPKKTGKGDEGFDSPDAKREVRPEKKNGLLGRRE